MDGIDTRQQTVVWRIAIWTVPLVLILGMASGWLSESGASDPWYGLLDKPPFQPPGWAFPVAWTVLYILMGLALAMVIAAPASRQRTAAIAFFIVQLALNLAWSPLFFGAHQVTIGFWLILAMLAAAVATMVEFAKIRRSAGWLLLPYIAWLCFASLLNFEIDQRNPDAESLAPPGAASQIQR